jgi:ribosome assembly protein YihI (activator of Der GTPase)
MPGEPAITDAIKSTPAYIALTKKFGADIALADLARLAEDASNQAEDLRAPKADVKKSVNALYQWFQANWDAISPVLDDLNLSPDDEEEEDEDEDEDDD